MTEEAVLPRSARFRRERETAWRELEAILHRVERGGPKVLGFEEARRLAILYREVCTSVSVAREISLDAALLNYLEALVARAYLVVYAPQERLGGLIGRFFLEGAPAAIRRSALHIIAGFMIMGLGAVVAYLLYFEDSTWFNTLIPGGLAGRRGPSSETGELLDVIYGQAGTRVEQLSAFAAYLFSHNTQIAFFCFSLGVAVGLPTALLCFYNGLVLGAFVALHVDRGIGWDLFGWISIHGVTELSAIAIAAGGGFRLGTAVLFPGRLGRRDALRLHGRDAAKLALVAALMLLVAGLVEGVGRQLINDTSQRLMIGWGLGLVWLAWFAFAGRPGRRGV